MQGKVELSLCSGGTDEAAFPQCTGDTGEPACTCGKCGSSLYFHAIWSFPRRLPILRPHPGSLRSPTSGLSEGMPASPAQGKACTIPCVPATNEPIACGWSIASPPNSTRRRTKALCRHPVFPHASRVLGALKKASIEAAFSVAYRVESGRTMSNPAKSAR